MSDEMQATAEDRPEHSEILMLILEAIQDLPESLRRAVRLRYECGLSYKEIAAELAISINAVGIRLYRARKILQRKLKPKF